MFLERWPIQNLAGLFDCFRTHGQRIGTDTAQRFLRRVGKDCFALSPEVIAAFQQEGFDVAQTPTRKKDLATIQAAFNEWHHQSGLSYLHLSEILALSLSTETREDAPAYATTAIG
ncbi:MAG: hypothetical protein GKR94_24175 [Gammaproteobacteria bacterium]|nr:hypothetical protein [Gammaproteobacteria bacterium]